MSHLEAPAASATSEVSLAVINTAQILMVNWDTPFRANLQGWAKVSLQLYKFILVLLINYCIFIIAHLCIPHR